MTKRAHNRIELDHEELKKLYAKGYAITDIANIMKKSVYALRNRVKELNLPEPLKKIPRKSPSIINLNVNEIIRLYQEELLTVLQIAKKMNVNHGTINLRLKKSGIKLRTQKETQKIIMNRPEVKENISKASIASNKQRIQTNLKKYGHIVPSLNPKIKEKGQTTFFKNYTKERIEKILNKYNLNLQDKYINNSIKYNFQCLNCNRNLHMYWDHIVIRGCPFCNPLELTYSSKAEKEISTFIKELGFKITNNSRSIIPPHELDIYIPEKQIAIEYDGLYFHSSPGPNNILPSYHLNKTKECEKQGIQLIHIFEDEWILKRNIVESRLKQILGVNKSKRIHARKCLIKEITPKIKNEFLETYHIQGKDSSNIKLGVFHQDELVSVMTFAKGNISKGNINKVGIWELNRFCSNSNYHIPGIASKLLKHFQRNYEWKEIFSYADRRWSNGNLYYKLGFELERKTGINYWYIKDFQRIHRFGFRKQPDEPKDIPEWILREQEGLYRIFDCGNLKFKLVK